jgi:enterochelin esterase-like enzyme
MSFFQICHLSGRILYRNIVLTFIFLNILPTRSNAQSGIPAVRSGQIVRFASFKSKFVADRNVDVWLPDGFNPSKRYAVVYMHDGQMLFDSSGNWAKQEWGVDETFGRLMNGKKILDCIVVGIWNTNDHRYGEYFPEKPFNLLEENEKGIIREQGQTLKHCQFINGKPNSDDYLRFLVRELKPFIDRNFPTLRKSSDTFIMGSSMGGLISLYAMCEYPRVFGGAACLSTHVTGMFTNQNNPFPKVLIEYLHQNLPKPRHQRFYFDRGTTTLDSLYEPTQIQVDSVFKAIGFSEENFQSLTFPGEPHTETAWKKRLEIPILFLLTSGSSQKKTE